jgi:hypothetical protein
MCIARNYQKTKSTKALSKLHHLAAKHELLVTTEKSAAHVQHSLHNQRQQENEEVSLTRQSANIPSLESSPGSSGAPESTSSCSSKQNIVASGNSPPPLEDNFDFEYSFLQIPTGGVIVTPRQEAEIVEMKGHASRPLCASAPSTRMHIPMKPDSFDFSSLHKIVGTASYNAETALATASPGVTTRSMAAALRGTTISSDDFVYATPRMHSPMMSTPLTTPRPSSGRECIFIDVARLSESLLVPML